MQPVVSTFGVRTRISSGSSTAWTLDASIQQYASIREVNLANVDYIPINKKPIDTECRGVKADTES